MMVSAMLQIRGRAAVVVLLALLAACAGTRKPEPTPLEPLTPKVTGRQVWKFDLGDVRFPLAVAVNDGTFTVADDGGTVLALQADTGREMWRAEIGDKLSAGVGSDGRFASGDARQRTRHAEAGKPKWRSSCLRAWSRRRSWRRTCLRSGVDRTVQAFDALDAATVGLSTAQRCAHPGEPGVLTPSRTPWSWAGSQAGGSIRCVFTSLEATVASPRGP